MPELSKSSAASSLSMHIAPRKSRDVVRYLPVRPLPPEIKTDEFLCKFVMV
jgi:hypothetical protein